LNLTHSQGPTDAKQRTQGCDAAYVEDKTENFRLLADRREKQAVGESTAQHLVHDPSIQSTMINFNTALRHHLFNITVTE
jgi:hypothetical protein